MRPSAYLYAAALQKVRACLKHRGLGVGAEDALQRLDDLALGRVRSRRRQQRLHQVAVRGRRLAQLAERALDRVAVAAGAQRLDAADLLALQLRRDAQDLELAILGLLVAVDADDDPLLALDL